jgi:hypothetical protein
LTPTARSLALLKRSHYIAGVVERWLPRVERRKDLFGCIDLVAVHRCEPGVLGVQATSMSNVSARVRKAQERPELRTWLAAGNRFEVWGWSGQRVKRVALKTEDLQAVVVQAPKRRLPASTQPELFA